jgi:AcrR family transcriptional regulator
LHPPRRRTSKKGRYHHGNLQKDALRCALELVKTGGPAAVTLRGVARLLGVTAPAIVYHFGSIATFKASVAQAVLDQAAEKAGARLRSERRPAREVGAAWIDFAADNPNLYRLAAGEGWHRSPSTTGIQGCGIVVPSPRRLLQDTFERHTRRLGAPRGDRESALSLAFTVHGLALARIDGVGGDAVAAALAYATEPRAASGPPLSTG